MNAILRWVQWGLAFGLAAPLFAVPPFQTAQLLAAGQPVTIVCFGDSVTGVYYHSGGHRAWCDLLGWDLSRIYPGAKLTMVNAGISGNTTAQGLARMQTDVLSHHPQLVVSMFGLNDLARGADPEEFRAHLIQIVERTRAAGAEAILMTPNSIYPGDPQRPPLGAARYAEVVRAVGRSLGVPIADAFSAFEGVRTADQRAWERLMSETIHPNLYGHALFAEEVALTLSGQRPEPADLPPLRRGLARVRGRLLAHQPVRVLAMKPYDRWIGAALQQGFPGALVSVTAWDADHKSLADLIAEAKARERFKAPAAEPDLVLLAVPAEAGAFDGSEYFREYSMILNWTLPFGPDGWDTLVALPSALNPQLDPAQRVDEALAREVAQSKDQLILERSSGDARSPVELLADQLK